MTVDTHEVVFSFDQPGDARNPLLLMLQQLLNRPFARDSKAAALLGSQRVLIVDAQQERAQYIAHLLSSAGYWPFVAPTPLDAYTLFLQGTFHPFAIVLSEESAANQFFLTRLSQQFLQRYDWKVPFIRLRVPPAEQLGARTTDPLSGSQIRPRPSGSLGHPGASSIRRSQPLGRSPASLSGPLRQVPSLPPPGQQPPPPRLPAARPNESSIRPSLPGSSPSAPAQQQLVRMRPPSAPLNPASYAGIPDQPSLRGGSIGPNSQIFSRSLGLTRGNKQGEKVSLDGLNIGRYQLKSLLGGNPIGDVYLTYDRLREQDIALKTIQTNMIPFHLVEGLEDDYNLFQREWDLLQKIDHPHISRVMSIGKSYISGFPFIYKTMPYYAEGSLASWLNQFTGKHFAAVDVARVILQLADAVQLIHNHGQLYQNFKLTNVMVLNDTDHLSDLRVAITDLPFVHDVINLPKTSESYRYIAPEQWEGEVFTSSDQYGLAVIAYELLTGRAPFQGNSEAIMRRMHLTMPAPAPSSFDTGIYPFIDKVFQRALAKRPEERFESVSAFATAFERAAN